MEHIYAFYIFHTRIVHCLLAYPFLAFPWSCVHCQKSLQSHGIFVSAGTVNCFATQITTCPCTSRRDTLCPNMLNMFSSFLYPSNICPIIESIDMFFLSSGNVPLMQRPMYVVQSIILISSFLPSLRHVRRCMLSSVTIVGKNPCILINYFVSVRNLGATRCLMWHFQYGVRRASMMWFGPAHVSSMQIVE